MALDRAAGGTDAETWFLEDIPNYTCKVLRILESGAGTLARGRLTGHQQTHSGMARQSSGLTGTSVQSVCRAMQNAPLAGKSHSVRI